MSRFTFSGILVAAALFTAGCAVAPVETAGTPDAASAAVGGGGSESVADTLVVDAGNLDPGSRVVCREMLKPNSNVVVTQCMTRDDWELFERRQAQQAAALVRMLQGGGYR